MDETKLMGLIHHVFYPGMPRLGPGDATSTGRALDAVLAARARDSRTGWSGVLDLGCGNGASTIELAKRIDTTILAVDNYRPYLDELEGRAAACGAQGRIRTRVADMREMDLGESCFDLVWCEGAIFVIGFREGLEACWRLLAPGGFLAVTELCWFSDDAPEECREYFAGQYPSMTSDEENVACAEELGYLLIDNFRLPEGAWWDSYYVPLERGLEALRVEDAGEREILEFVETIQREIDVYRKYSSFYGYSFYVMQRPH
jgi:SAM-dependent methyltransferase